MRGIGGMEGMDGDPTRSFEDTESEKHSRYEWYIAHVFILAESSMETEIISMPTNISGLESPR